MGNHIWGDSESNRTIAFDLVWLGFFQSQGHPNFEILYFVKKPELGPMLLLNINRESYMGVQQDNEILTSSDLERSNPTSLGFWRLISCEGAKLHDIFLSTHIGICMSGVQLHYQFWTWVTLGQSPDSVVLWVIGHILYIIYICHYFLIWM